MNGCFKIVFLLGIAFLGCNEAEPKRMASAVEISSAQSNEIDLAALKQKAAEAKQFCKSKKYNTEFFILIDLKRHSGLKRFYIWDFKKESLAHSFLVSHGCGPNPWGKDDSKENAAVSNADGSHLSSVGKYLIGKRGYSNWGIHVNYLMHGLDATNSNAEKRQIVLHSWEDVTDNEIFPNGTAEGWGCPALSNSAMRVVDAKLKNSKKVLLWIVN